jgi:RimJ/RimL family protein N-acetyltransferase
VNTFVLDFQPLPGATNAARYAAVPWDSEILGIRVYELQLGGDVPASAEGTIRDWLEELRRGDACLVHAAVDQTHVSALELLAANGFYPVESALALEMGLASVRSPAPGGHPNVRLRPTAGPDVDRLCRIAATAFWADRFHLDPHVSDDAANRRYFRWLQRAYEEGETLFTYERTDTGEAIGFYLVRPVTDALVDLTLVALDPTETGRGLGSVLYRLVLDECAAMGFLRAQTRTVAHNLPALNILTALGFAVTSARIGMHWHSCGRTTA